MIIRVRFEENLKGTYKKIENYEGNLWKKFRKI